MRRNHEAHKQTPGFGCLSLGGRGWGGWGGFELQAFLQISGFKFMVSDFATSFVSREVEAKTTDPAVCNWCLES